MCNGLFDARLIILAGAIILSGCQLGPQRSTAPSTVPSNTTTGSAGGFYGGDLPPANVPINLALVPNAVPISLPLSKTGNKPYMALGKRYIPLTAAGNYRARGTASWYGKKFHGRRTSSGEPYNMFAMTAAHPLLPLPSFVRVTHLGNGKSVVVKVNDRGPFLHGRIIDLSYAAAWKLGITATGTGLVEVAVVTPATVTAASTRAQSVTGIATNPTAASDNLTKVLNQAVNINPVSSIKLQIGAFSILENALQQRRQLRQAGFPLQPEFDEHVLGSGPPYRVVAGPFQNLAHASQAKLEIEILIGRPVILQRD